VLRIHSPSKVFEDYGRMTSAGFARGIEHSSSMIDDAVGDAYDLVPPVGAGGGGGRNSITVNVPVTVQVNGGRGGAAAANEIAAALRDVLPAELRSAFQRLNVAAGAA
jgi:hypothetical protein